MEPMIRALTGVLICTLALPAVRAMAEDPPGAMPWRGFLTFQASAGDFDEMKRPVGEILPRNP